MMKRGAKPTVFALLGLTAALAACAAEPRGPNVVVILTDDQGYADISFNPLHPPEVSTPHIDTLARAGVFFAQAYTSSSYCSPTRAGLMLGRYQQRVGVYTASEGGDGFDPSIPIFPSFLPDEYVSAAIGKWHLGLDEDYPALAWHALNRGFDEAYLFMGRGAHDYFRLKGASGTHDSSPIYRNRKRIDDEGYLTTRLTEEACAFIERHKQRPFFLYLAYNALHAPRQAPQEDIERFRARFPHLSEDRATLMAMLYHLDLGVGAVVRKLKDEGLWDDTLLFFLTDNGGSRGMGANNAPLRGWKKSKWEGGIRTPLIVSWPRRIRGGRTVQAPVISLDILPTALDALDVPLPEGTSLDGKSLLPLLDGRAETIHESLFWSSGGADGEWAVRSGNWKLVGLRERRLLFDLAADPSEKLDLATRRPEKVAELTRLYDRWLDRMAEPLHGGGKRWVQGATGTRGAQR
jgi:arylsulfatase A-like enzyme